jgi:hypothetical protein
MLALAPAERDDDVGSESLHRNPSTRGAASRAEVAEITERELAARTQDAQVAALETKTLDVFAGASSYLDQALQDSCGRLRLALLSDVSTNDSGSSSAQGNKSNNNKNSSDDTASLAAAAAEGRRAIRRFQASNHALIRQAWDGLSQIVAVRPEAASGARNSTTASSL